MRLSLFFALLLLTSTTRAAGWIVDQRLSSAFEEARVAGTFVLYDLQEDVFTAHNKERAHQRYLPASTYKIANSLIGLATGAVSSVDEILPYGGGPQFLKSWEKDMGLRDAIPISNVPIYQELARRIGLERMRNGVEAIGYGNAQIGSEVDTFWLKGPLQISTVEQVRFLAQLADGSLPSFSKQVQSAVREITLLESGDNWALHGKTGWASSVDPAIGWWVGWLVKDDRIYSFALNIDIVAEGDGAKRIELAKACLRILGFPAHETPSGL